MAYVKAEQHEDGDKFDGPEEGLAEYTMIGMDMRQIKLNKWPMGSRQRFGGALW